MSPADADQYKVSDRHTELMDRQETETYSGDTGSG